MNNSEIYQLDEEEIDIIKKSEEDIKHRRVISQEDLDKEDLEWLSEICYSNSTAFKNLSSFVF
ncbi:hypothetical protein [Flavobacterium sp. 3-210]